MAVYRLGGTTSVVHIPDQGRPTSGAEWRRRGGGEEKQKQDEAGGESEGPRRCGSGWVGYQIVVVMGEEGCQTGWKQSRAAHVRPWRVRLRFGGMGTFNPLLQKGPGFSPMRPVYRRWRRREGWWTDVMARGPSIRASGRRWLGAGRGGGEGRGRHRSMLHRGEGGCDGTDVLLHRCPLAARPRSRLPPPPAPIIEGDHAVPRTVGR